MTSVSLADVELREVEALATLAPELALRRVVPILTRLTNDRTFMGEYIFPLLEQPVLRVEGARNVIGALEAMAEGNVDFADALLAVKARSRGGGVASFDRDFRKLAVEWRAPG